MTYEHKSRTLHIVSPGNETIFNIKTKSNKQSARMQGNTFVCQGNITCLSAQYSQIKPCAVQSYRVQKRSKFSHIFLDFLFVFFYLEKKRTILFSLLTHFTIEDMLFTLLYDAVDFRYKSSITHIHKIVHRPIIDVIVNVRRYGVEFSFDSVWNGK